MPLLEQKREKEEVAAREREKKKIPEVCLNAPEEHLSDFAERAEKCAEADGQRQAASGYHSAGGAGRAR